MNASSTSAFVRRRPRTRHATWHQSAVGRRLVFLHIPKTAGTAITSFLRQQFDDSEVMPQLEMPFHRSHPIWPLIARRHQLLGVGMHLEHEHVDAFQRGLANDRPPFLLTVLREPKKRLLSQYKEWRSTSDEVMHVANDELKDAILTARTRPFSEFLRSENPMIRVTLNNLQTRLLVGRNLARTLSDAELLSRARHNLAQYDLVGTTASCDATVAMLADAYGWALPESAPRRHVSKLPPAAALATTPADEEQIAAFTALDQALWDDLVNDRLPDPPALHDDTRPIVPDSFCTRLVVDTRPDASPESLRAARASRLPPQEGFRESRSHADYLACIYATVERVVNEHAATRVLDLDRRMKYPMPEDKPQPLATDERVAFIVRLAALSYHASYLVLQAAVPPAGLLVITEIDNDPRLIAWLLQADVSPYATHTGDGDGAVVTVRIGALAAAHGSDSVRVLIESLMRCQQTHPSALKTLQDMPATRELAHWQLQHALAAVVHCAETPHHSGACLIPLLATLRPDAEDALPGAQAVLREAVPSLITRFQQALPLLLDTLPPSSEPQLRFTVAVLQAASDHLDTAPTAHLVDTYHAVFTLLCHLLTRPLHQPFPRTRASAGVFDFSSSLQVSNAHRLEGVGAKSFRWLGPHQTSRMLLPVQPNVPQQLSVFIAAFIDPEVFAGATYHLNGSLASPVCSVEDHCTVATFAISPEAASAGAIELTITAPFTASELEKGLSTDPRQKSMALRQVRITPQVTV